jgi:YbgC/YbaW family acyl-CoA thioester hydrolase
MKRSEFRFLDPLRVRWAEVDMQRVVFNAHYLTWFDTALGAWWRALALPYEETLTALDGDLFLRRAALDYEAPAHYDEALAVGIRYASAGTSSLRFEAGVFREDDLLVRGELVYVWTDPPAAPRRRPRPLPPDLVAAFEAHAAGETMVAVELGDWGAVGDAARAQRAAVFVDEQRIAAAIERDAADATAVHALARNRLGRVVGTGRLLPADASHPARIGRMAVRRDLRGARIGRAVLEALMAHAGARGDAVVALHAQASAIGFYERAGFGPHGPRFVEAGIEHQEMRRAP